MNWECQKLSSGSRVKYKQLYLDCWNGKDRKFYEVRKGTILGVYGMSATIKWDDALIAKAFIPDLEDLKWAQQPTVLVKVTS
jgi:hypothetical protein